MSRVTDEESGLTNCWPVGKLLIEAQPSVAQGLTKAARPTRAGSGVVGTAG